MIDANYRAKLQETASALGVSPVDLATVISYETGGTFDPAQPGPRTKWGQHRGLIQFGEPQARQYGVDWEKPLESQLGKDGAVVRYLTDRGFQRGGSLLDMYSTINAGAPGLYDRSDEAAGGMPGTVRDKVETQFADHRRNAERLFQVADASGGYTLQDIEAEIARRQSGQSSPATSGSSVGYSLQDIEAEIARREAAQPAPEAPGQPVSRGEALGRGALQGATFGFSDEIAGGTIDRKTYQERYIALRREGIPHAEAEKQARQEGFGAAAARTEEVRAANAAAQEARPGYYMGGEIGGAIATGLLPGGAVSNAMRGGSLAARSAASGATAGAQGAAYGFGTGEGGAEARLQNAGEIGAIGAGAGAAIPFFGRAISQIANVGGKGRAAAQLRQAAPAVQELQQSARALFDAAERSGVKINSQAYDNMVGGLAKKMTDEGMDEMLHPAAARVLSRLQGAAGSEPTMAELMTLRRVLSMGANDVTNRDQTRLVSMMVDEFDDYLTNLKPRDFLSGSGPSKQALADWKEARDLWSRSLKAGVIEDAFTRAGNAASGLENGLRNEFRRILNNPKMVRRFSPEERKAIGQVANGTVSANVLRKLSRFGFGLTGERNFLGGSIGAAGGAAALGPAGAIIVPALGMAASKGAETVAKRGAQTARAMAATGQVPAVRQIATDELERLLLRAAPGVPASQ